MAIRKARQVPFRPHIGAVELCPGFFDQHRPKFSLLTFAESHFTVLVARKVIINDHGSPDSVHVEIDQIGANLIDLLALE